MASVINLNDVKTITYTRDQLGFPKSIKRRNDLFGDGSKKHLRPLNVRHAVSVVKGAYSFDRDYLGSFLPQLRDELSSRVAAGNGTDSEEFCNESGWAREPTSILGAAGYPMSPMSLLPYDNAKARSDLGLPRTWRSERDQLIVREFFELMFSTWVATSIKAPSGSTAGFPTFEYRTTWKKAAALNILTNHEDVLNSFAKRDVFGLIQNYGCVFCMNGGVRLQVDQDVNKKRIAYSLEYSMGRSDVVTYADKRVSIQYDGVRVDYPEISAMRARFINGASFTTNVLPQVVASGTMKAMFINFPMTFHHTDIHEVTYDLNTRADACMTDVSDYDRTIGTFILDELYRAMAKFWDHEVVGWFKQLMNAPYYTRPVEHDGTQGIWVGDPFQLRPQVVAGNRSGHGGTSLVSKLVKVAETLTVIDQISHDVLGNVARYLAWEMPIAMKNNGDDEALCGPRSAIVAYRKMRAARTASGEVKYGYLSVSLEVGQVFSGYYFTRTSDGKLKPLRRAIALLEKTLLPEVGIDSSRRKFEIIGRIERMLNGRDMPTHGETIRILNQVWDRTIGKRVGRWQYLIEEAQRNMPVIADAYTRIDLEVLENPDKLHYLYDESEVSPHVVAALGGAIVADDTLEIGKAYFTGNIISMADFKQRKEENEKQTTRIIEPEYGYRSRRKVA